MKGVSSPHQQKIGSGGLDKGFGFAKIIVRKL